ncbi:AraC family transcriptional regulator [Paenibacillus wenxiniae]|uniref:AraC family transcriptional regulator n=1 Tax=Paenibacillus wenxiniae TaxID=1636843 RepID=A0ABW4RKW0_9BACL
MKHIQQQVHSTPISSTTKPHPATDHTNLFKYKPFMLQELDEYVFRIRDVEKIRGKGDFRLPQQYISTHTLLIIAEGSGLLTREHERVRVQSQSVYWFAPGSTLGLRSWGRKGLSIYLLRFDCYRETNAGQELVQEQASLRGNEEKGRQQPQEHDHPNTYMKRNSEPAQSMDEMQGGKDERIQTWDCPISGTWLLPICEELYTHWHAETTGSRTRANGLFLQLLCDLHGQEQVEEGDASMKLQRTRVYIEQHYREPLTLEQLAEMAGLSRNYYVSLFKKQYGESVVHYITHLRMEHARRLMANPELRLRDIAHQIGYNDEFYFSRKFKQETGITPSAYIRNHTRKLASYDPITTGYLLALGVMPYAAPLHPKWTAHDEKRYAANIPVHLNVQRATMHWQNNLDILRRCAPEWIIAPDHISDHEKELLQQIAEVYYIDSSARTWKQQLFQLATTLGSQAEQNAKVWLNEYHQQVQPIRERLEQSWMKQQERIAFARYWKGNFYSCYFSEAAYMLRDDLGMSLLHLTPDEVEDEGMPLSAEHLAKRNIDRLLLLVCQESETLQHWRELQSDSIWLSLRAVQQQTLHVLPSDPWRDRSPEAYKRMALDLDTRLQQTLKR